MHFNCSLTLLLPSGDFFYIDWSADIVMLVTNLHFPQMHDVIVNLSVVKNKKET